MAEITVKVEKRVLGWKLGQVITLERTRLIDNLIKNNALTEVETPDPDQPAEYTIPEWLGSVPGLPLPDANGDGSATVSVPEPATITGKANPEPSDFDKDVALAQSNFGEGPGDAEQGAGDGDDQSAEDLDGPAAEGEGPR